MKMKRILFLVVVIAISAASAFPQNSTELRGRVTDERNANIAGADVRVRSRSGGELLTTTDGNGTYAFANLAAGDYVLEIRANGFAASASRVTIQRGQTVTNDLRLSLEAINETVSVTGTGIAQTVDETSKAISVLDNLSIETKGEIGLSESLRGIPGVRVQQQGSPGALTSVRLRGQRTSDTALLLDGLRVRDASDINGAAGPLFADLAPTDLDRVEVLRGSGSSIYGSNAIGGAINLVPAATGGDRHFEFGLDGGSLAQFRERVRGSGGIGKRAGFSFGLSRVDVRHGVDGNDEYGNTAGSGRFQLHPTRSSTLSVSFYGTNSNARINDSPFALPAAFSSGQYPRAIEGTTFHSDLNNPDEGRRNRLLVTALRFTDQVNNTFSYSVAYQHVGSRRRNYNGPAIDPQFAAFYPFGDFEFVAENKGSTDTFDARANFRFGRQNLLTAGFEYERESIFQSAIPSFSAFNNTTDRQRTMALFAQDQIFLLEDRLQISVAARGQWFRIRAADRPGFLGSINPESSITGDGSIAYFIRSTGTKLRAHVGNGFRAPALFERFGAGTFAQAGFTRFGDPTLRAEQSISVDGGFDQRVANDRARFGATYFYTHLQRVIAFNSFFVVDPLGAGRFSGYENRPGGFARGVETYFEAAPWRGADWRASYTFTNSDRFVRGSGLQREYVIPKHLFGLNVNQRYRSFVVSFDLNHTGSHLAPIFENDFPFRTAELTFPGYTKADLFASYERRISERVTLTFFGGADNLFDVTYFENGFRSPGIVARAGLRIAVR
ncbi:MAG TPA: TonB-dependent receptor [Pyrinomonadaceae bacterium]|nr:TonB-dependent receptor [Pyrinomonadaceae bacterium]